MLQVWQENIIDFFLFRESLIILIQEEGSYKIRGVFLLVYVSVVCLDILESSDLDILLLRSYLVFVMGKLGWFCWFGFS